jgi:hypothetical protein
MPSEEKITQIQPKCPEPAMDISIQAKTVQVHWHT